MNSFFEKVIFIGPLNEAGGIGSVLSMYRKYIIPFKSLSTYTTGNKKKQILFFLKKLFELNKVLSNDKKLQILHIHSASNGSFVRKSIVAFLGKLHGKKIIFHIHSGSFDKYYRRWGVFKPLIRRILKSMDKVVCLTDQWYIFYTNTLKLSNVLIIGNPVEMPDLIGLPKKNEEIIQLLFLGKICDAKGIFQLLEYLKNNKHFLNNNISLKIAGNGEINRLEHILKEDVFSERVEYCGWVKDHAKDKLLTQCDIYILPSYFEGLPVSILEAMAYGKPIIASNVGGVPSIVKNNYNGWLFNPGQFNELDHILDSILINPHIVNSFKENSRKTAALFSPETILADLNDVYQSVLQQ